VSAMSTSKPSSSSKHFLVDFKRKTSFLFTFNLNGVARFENKIKRRLADSSDLL
jgi:hypothetical protein